MKVLVVGGSGLIGGDAALYLASQGHEVTIMSRHKPTAPALAALDFIACDYINDDVNDGRLNGFDWMLFSAAADIRNVPIDGSITSEAFYKQANDTAVPRFFKAARNAGISRAVYIGTFYPQVAADKIGVCPYVTSRHNTDEALRALSSDHFTVCSLNAPFVLGCITGLAIPHIDGLIAYVRGQIPGAAIFAPPGGTNHISSRSIAQAVLTAFERGQSGKAYLLGDENLSWKQYFELWFEAVGNPQQLEVRDEEHPMIPNIILFAGVGATVSYESQDADFLGYQRQQIKSMIAEVVAQAG